MRDQTNSTAQHNTDTLCRKYVIQYMFYIWINDRAGLTNVGPCSEKFAAPTHRIKTKGQMTELIFVVQFQCQLRSAYFRLVSPRCFPYFTNRQLRPHNIWHTCVGPLKCGGPCSTEHVRTFLSLVLINELAMLSTVNSII